MNIVIFGANGQTGRLLTRQAVDAGHHTVAVTRKPGDFPVSHPRLTVAGADVRDAASLRGVLDGSDVVLSVLGVPFGRAPIDTYSTGVTNVVAAMDEAGVRRLAVVSSTAVGRYPGRTGAPFALQLFEPVIKRTVGKTTYDDQRRMEEIVRGSDLDWTIVRPSGLFDLPYVTDYVAGQVDPVGAFTSRTDLAHYLLTLAAVPGGHETVTISTVADTPTMWQMIRREAFKSA
ncbi:NAD(P)H-binding protein [Mycobacterium sp. 21AC1]|uniref:NAD(P)-dependent oxidoreductase n=1 Tax=[Mycobacterium] appelbergii TaxID=2939269 RepID=UPI0029394F7E|nr:NAD(P)H-binding protein [Mycobacterium sp. 21AC1]MDV3127144.1 NAD(P)H-binding protein [Mycobacterium sp. 21AC1]